MKTKLINSNPIVVKNNYNTFTDKECQLCKISKTDLTGFMPRSTTIRRMFAQGELYTIMKEFEVGNMMSRDTKDIPVGLANIKGLDKLDLEKGIKSRIEHYHKLVDDAKDSLNKSLQAHQRNDSAASEPHKLRADDENVSK